MAEVKIPAAAYIIIGVAMILMSVFINPEQLAVFVFVGAIFVFVGFFKFIIAHGKKPKHHAHHAHKQAKHAAHKGHKAAHHAAHHAHKTHHTTVSHCAKCGVKLHPLFHFCPKCGQKLK